uniref:Peritrophin 1 n=1 Tax=Mamestra configurata TaxID=174822 RepID=Q86BV0_9NEOP|nr:peritrophin 1 [Mamestra configurata]
MKDAVILLLCAVALAQGLNQSPDHRRPCNCDPSEAQQICQANYDNDDVLIAHENCDQFYKCANGKPVAYFCPNNLRYDPFSETCEWPDSVDCGNRPISDGPDKGEDNDSDDVSDVDNDWTCNCNPGEAPSICAAEGSNGILVAHQNCNQFYKCAEGRPVTFDCSPTLLYNPYKEECDWAHNVECGDRVIPDLKEDDSSDDDNNSTENDGTCNCNPEEAPAICAAPGSESQLIAHENCNKYYICNHGLPVAVSCVGDLLFNPYTRECDWPRNVDCGDRLVPETECTGCNDNASNDASCDGDDDDSVPTPGVTNPAVTNPDPESSDSGSSEIRPPGDDVVVPPRPPGTCNCNPGEAPSICASEDSDGVLVAHENCNQFYKCDHGKPVVLSCYGDLLYNPYTEQCDWPENVDCGDRVIPDPDDSVITPGVTNPGVTNPGVTNPGVTNPADTTPGNNCDPSEAPAICAADDSEGVLVAHENCNQFYMCSGGKPVALKCPPNLLFNPAKDKCDWPENVDCGDRVVPDPESSDSGSSEIRPPGDDVVAPTRPPGTCNCNPGEAPSICAAEDSDGVLVAHENCNQFYKCDHGKPVVLSCYGGLLYNPYTEQCDWPENVDCGDRVIPDPDDSVITPGVTNPGMTNPGVTNPGVTNPADTTPGNNCDPSEAPAICAADDSEGVLVAHENCNQFYMCSGGKPVALKCPPNLLFNPAKDQCDWPENVDCGDRVIPDPESSDSGSSEIRPPGDDVVVPPRPPGTCNCNPGEAPSICASGDSDGVLVAHENCNQFYKCDHGKPVVLSCYGDLLYNPYTEQCDWPENVDCGDRVIPDPDDSVITPGVTNPGVTNPGVTNPGVTNPADTTPGNNCDPSEAPAICAADDSEGVLVAHENCNQFYMCSGGKPVALKCPPNLLFNPAKDQCDWPENVDCGDRVIPDPESSDSGSSEIRPPGDDVVVPPRPPGTCNCNPGEAPSICASEDSDGVLVAHENCNQFYKCDHGKPVVLSCYGDLLYNPYTEQCDWPENVDCGDRVIPDPDDSVITPGVTNPGVTNPGVTNPGVTNPADTTPGNNCDPSEAPAICAADDSEGVLVAHENCNQFYMCSGGKPVALKCPPNLLFNPAKDQCDWPENVDCGDRVIPDPESSDSGSSEIRPPGDDVVVPPRPPGTCNCNPGEAPSICASGDSDGVLVAHENCNQFYKCDHGKPVVLSCYGDLLYNPYTEQCDWPENVDCGDRVIPDPDDSVITPGVTNPGVTNPGVTNPGVTNPADTTPGNNCDPSEAPAICAADDSEGVLVAHENCNQFYMCSGSKPVALKCPPNLLFNPAKDQCDWPENVDCGDRVIPDPESSDSGSSEIRPPGDDVVAPTRPPGTCNCNPGEAPSICAAEDSDGVLVAHENCNQFYKCDHGKPVVLSCYGGLLYNPYTEQCDWPENVDCGDRVIPDPDDSVITPGVTNPGVTNPGVTNPGVTNPADTTPGNNCDPSEAPAICAADDSEGVLVAHENCNQFYKCSGGKPVALTCPPNLLFNPNKDQCDWPENVDCGDRVIPNPESSDSGSSEIRPPGDDVPPQPPVVDSNEDCSGISDENGSPCNCDPDQAPSICAVDNSEGVLIAHENCNQFYQCVNGRPIPLKCPVNTLYNPVSQVCDWAFNVECGDRIIPDPEENVSESNEDDSKEEEPIVGPCNCNPEEAPAICAVDGSSGVQIAHENCNQFYICDHGRPVAFTCNGFLLYNPYTERCDWPEHVQCGDRVIPEPGNESDENDSNEDNISNPNDDPSQAPTICAGNGSEGVLVAHENCDQYYICSGGVPVSRPCNDGLLYNPYNQRCDWPSNVVCGDRIVPDDCACNPRNAPALCAKPGSQGKLVAHENCNQFYICSNSVPVSQTCPASLVYNPDREFCDWPQNVNCENRLLSYASLNKHWQSRQTLRN